jgi:hypothetical protein
VNTACSDVGFCSIWLHCEPKKWGVSSPYDYSFETTEFATAVSAAETAELTSAFTPATTAAPVTALPDFHSLYATTAATTTTPTTTSNTNIDISPIIKELTEYLGRSNL